MGHIAGLWICTIVLCIQLSVGCGFNPAVDGPPAGNPDGNCPVPPEAQAEDTSNPDHVIGNGTPESCTSQALADAVAQGGIITFNCGPDPVTLAAGWIEIINPNTHKVVIDGGGRVAILGNDFPPILSLHACNSADCIDQEPPQLIIQNLTFYMGQSGERGGAIAVYGGRLKVVNCRFFSNSCKDVADEKSGGGAIFAMGQYDNMPLYVVNSTFGGRDDLGNHCTQGGAIVVQSITLTIINSMLSNNFSNNPDDYEKYQTGMPGFGLRGGGAILITDDGDNYPLSLCGVRMTDNHARGFGGAIYFQNISQQPGVIRITNSVLRNNRDSGGQTAYPGIYAVNGQVLVDSSTIE